MRQRQVQVTISAEDVAGAWARWQDALRKWPSFDEHHKYAQDAHGRYTAILDLFEHAGGDFEAVRALQQQYSKRWPLTHTPFVPEAQRKSREFNLRRLGWRR